MAHGSLRVDASSPQEGQKLNVELRFKNMDDFSPENVAKRTRLAKSSRLATS